MRPLPSPCAETILRLARDWADKHVDEKTGLIRAALEANDHTDGKQAHLVRESAYFAYGLLLTGEPADARRAARALEGILPKQNLDEHSPMWGCFTYEVEQDWATWKKPDQNWAQFVGCALGHVLELEKTFPSIPAELRTRVKEAFVVCVRATLKRNVGASYTNIALLSSAVAALGAKVAEVPGAAEFARRKLGEVLALLPAGACFDEYLSPTYYGVNLLALATVRRCAADKETRAFADQLWARAWDDLGRFYHPATHQIGGPQSRAYGDEILGYVALVKYFLFLALEGDFPLSVAETQHTHDLGTLFLIAAQDVPPVPALRAPPMGALTVKQPDVGKRKGAVLSSWKEENFILGSVSVQDEWEQRRNWIAYWPGGKGVHPVVARELLVASPEVNLRLGRFFSAQNGSAVLVCVCGPRLRGQPLYAAIRVTADCEVATQHTRGGMALDVRAAGRTMRWTPISLGENASPAEWSHDSGGFLLKMLLVDERVPGVAFTAYLVEFSPSDPPPRPAALTEESLPVARVEGRKVFLSAPTLAGRIELNVELPTVAQG